MGWKDKCNFPWEKFPPPLIFLICSLVICIVAISLGAVAMVQDAKWNNNLDDHIMETMKNETTVHAFKNGTTLYTDEEYDSFHRNTWMKKAFMAIISILLVATLVHTTIYAIYHEEHYRYNFSLIFAFVAAILYLGAGVFIITSTIKNSNNVVHLHDIAATRVKTLGTTFSRTTYLPLIHACEAFQGDANEAHRKRLFAHISIEEMRAKAREVGICQLASVKYAAGFMAILNIFFMCGIFLTTRSKKDAEEIEYQNRRDLDYDENDPDWTCKLTTFKSKPRRRTELEQLGLPKLYDDSGPTVLNSDPPTVDVDRELPEASRKIETKDSNESMIPKNRIRRKSDNK